MCNNCIHKPVCGKFLATGGYVRECEHFKEERKARWRWRRNSVTTQSEFYCGSCDEVVPFGWTALKFCPNCGADMRGAEDA